MKNEETKKEGWDFTRSSTPLWKMYNTNGVGSSWECVRIIPPLYDNNHRIAFFFFFNQGEKAWPLSFLLFQFGVTSEQIPQLCPGFLIHIYRKVHMLPSIISFLSMQYYPRIFHSKLEIQMSHWFQQWPRSAHFMCQNVLCKYFTWFH